MPEKREQGIVPGDSILVVNQAVDGYSVGRTFRVEVRWRPLFRLLSWLGWSPIQNDIHVATAVGIVHRGDLVRLIPPPDDESTLPGAS